MTIRPVDFATIQRTDDVGMMKHQQDAKPVVEQQNIQVEIKKQEYHDASQVKHKDNASKEEERFDAREEGKNKYKQSMSKKKKDAAKDKKGADMTAIEICLVAAGLVLMVGSFFVTEKLSPDELDKIAKLSQEEIAHIVDKEIAASHDKVQEQLETELEEVLEKLDRESDKETNEKIMAISEYSDTVIESINKSHNEIMFLYSMLGDKHKEMIDFSNEIQQRVENLQKIVTEEMVQETLYKAKEEHENSQILMENVTENNKNMLEEVQAVSDEAEEVPETEETGELEKEQPADSNEQILELRRQGMSEVEIAKELGLGLGVIRLVIDLYEKEEQAE